MRNMIIQRIYQRFQKNTDHIPLEFASQCEDDACYLTGFAEGCESEYLRQMAIRLKAYAHFFRVMNQHFHEEFEGIVNKLERDEIVWIKLDVGDLKIVGRGDVYFFKKGISESEFSEKILDAERTD